MERQTAQDVLQSVDRDFKLHCRVTDTDDLIDRLFPVSKHIVDAILDTVKASKLYDNSRWKEFLVSKKTGKGKKPKEKPLYGAFVSTANAIHEAAKKATNQNVSTPDSLGATDWLDYHSKSPLSKDVDGTPIRPDCLLALTSLRKRIDALCEAEQDPDVARQMAVWWLQIVAAVEMKRYDTQPWEQVVKQLLGYLRRILQEQVDRRFVFGLTLGPSRMTVWMYDRSGALGTKASIDIHESPRKFIQVIAAFALLPVDKLGYDTTMKIYVSPTSFVPSYQLDEKTASKIRKNPYDIQWIITMNNGREYLTVKTLSMAHARVMRGRGMIAWVACACEQGGEDDQKEEGSKFVVLKQSWQPLDVQNEGEFYEQASSHSSEYLCDIDTWEDVVISGKRDETVALIRKGLTAECPSPAVTGEKRRRVEDQEPFLHVECTTEGEIQAFATRADDSREPLPRVRTRVILSTYGWPLKYFCSVRELIQVLKDAILGHQHMFKNGVLHRDISPGNIIIKWRPQVPMSSSNSEGVLIDLDRAKMGKNVEAGKAVPETKSDPLQPHEQSGYEFVSSLIRKQAQDRNTMTSTELEAFKIAGEVFSRASEVLEDALDVPKYVGKAVQHALDFYPRPQGGLCSAKILQWEKATTYFDFNFSRGEVQAGSRTGTLPYVSAEIMAYSSYSGTHSVHHDAVHDIESFFWVLLYISLTRSGPGGELRKVFTEELEDVESVATRAQYQRLRIAVRNIFDGDKQHRLEAKRQIINSRDHLSSLLDDVAPYFTSLRSLIVEWHSLLRLAYHFRAFEYHGIHDRVIQVLDKTLESMGPDEFENDATKKELKRREDDIATINSRGI